MPETNTLKSLVKSNDKIFGLIDGEWAEVTTSIGDLTDVTILEFDSHGMEDLSFLATPKTRTQLTMESVKLEGEGKTYSRKIKPNKYKNEIINIESI